MNTTQRGFDSRWWETPGAMRARLLRLDGEVGAMVNAEKHVAGPAVGSDVLARHLGRVARQMGLDAGAGTVGDSDSAAVFESIKPNYTREAGSGQRSGPAG